VSDTVESLLLDLLEWLARADRTYEETMEAWRTSCPKLPVWEEATDRRLIEFVAGGAAAFVRPTPAGVALLAEKRPAAGDPRARRVG
jgi:D-3-phosphoglycerate dehydrogenase